jgi:hypothetical protein
MRRRHHRQHAPMSDEVQEVPTEEEESQALRRESMETRRELQALRGEILATLLELRAFGEQLKEAKHV